MGWICGCWWIRSDSARDVLSAKLPEWEQILERSKGAKDRLHFVDYAAEAVKRGAILAAGSTEFSGQRTATRTSTALGYALAQIEADRAARLLVLTDGFSTEPLEGIAERLLKQEVALDYRSANASLAGDVRLAALTLPRRVLPREAFMVEVVAAADVDATVPVEILRNGQSMGQREVVLKQGIGRLRFTDRLATPARIGHRGPADACAGQPARQQRGHAVGGGASGPRVLLATAYPNDPMRGAAHAGFEVEVVTDLATLNVGHERGQGSRFEQRACVSSAQRVPERAQLLRQ